MKFLVLAALIGGMGFASNTADPGVSYSHQLSLQGKEKTTITVSGDGRGELVCELYDDKAKLLMEDTNPSDRCQLEWTPKTKVKLTLIVRNVGKRADHYTVIAQ